MKEIIEYIIAGIILLSIIPMYIGINTILYTPPRERVSPAVLALYTESINNVVYELISSNNLTPAIIDLNKYVIERVGSDVYRDYGYNVEIVSWGIINITVSDNIVRVYTRDKGNLTILVVYSTLVHEYYTLDTPTYSNELKGIYMYETTTTYSSIIAVVAILETGTAKYIDYYIAYSSRVKPLYIMNINGKIYLLNDVSNGNIVPSYYNGYPVVTTYIYYYTPSKMNVYRYLGYSHAIRATYYVCGYSWLEDCGAYLYTITRLYEDINYYSILQSGTITIDDREYQVLQATNFRYEEKHDETWRRLDIWGRYCRCWEFWFGWCTDEWRKVSDTLVETNLYRYDIAAPLYNAVLFVLKDSIGNIYIATPYYHRISFGDTPPSNWPIHTISYILRIGMIDYQVRVSVWRRTI